MPNLKEIEKNRGVLFNAMYNMERPFTATDLEKEYLKKLTNGSTNGSCQVDRVQTLREVLRDLEIHGILKKTGAYYEVVG